jgi:hypothetical protein
MSYLLRRQSALRVVVALLVLLSVSAWPGWSPLPGLAPVTALAATADGATTWYFAEGYTGAGFDTYLTILNPNTSAASVAITYYRTGGGMTTRALTVGATTRQTVAVHETAHGVGRGQAVAARVQSTNGVGIVVERPMYFTYNGGITGGHTVMGATAPSATWYFAEGFTGAGFDEYLSILNPGGSAASVRITYYLASGASVVKSLTVGASTRETVAVHETARGVGRGQAVSARVESTNNVGIVVERPMYFRYSGGVDGGHTVMGATSLGTTWYFAEGFTGAGFDEYLTILNPTGGAASIRITY